MACDHKSARLKKSKQTDKKKDFCFHCESKKKVLYGQQFGERLRSATLNVNKVTESVFEQADIVSRKRRGLRLIKLSYG